MLRNINDFMECTVAATDGHVGRVYDAYFDEEAWVVRYLAVDTELAAKKRCVLMPVRLSGAPQWVEHALPVALSREQITNSPEMHSPVSRQHVLDCLDYYTALGDAESRIECQRLRALDDTKDAAEKPQFQDQGEPHLHSVHDFVSYHLHAIDGDIGAVNGFLIDQQSWAIRFMIVRTGRWWIGHDILISPESIDEVRWGDASVVVDLTRAAVRGSPQFDESAKVDNREGEGSYEHHDRKEGSDPQLSAKNERS